VTVFDGILLGCCVGGYDGDNDGVALGILLGTTDNDGSQVPK